MAKAITKHELNQLGCGIPNCGHDHSILYLHSNCHIKSGTRVRYDKLTETLIINCTKCGKEVIQIQL